MFWGSCSNPTWTNLFSFQIRLFVFKRAMENLINKNQIGAINALLLKKNFIKQSTSPKNSTITAPHTLAYAANTKYKVYQF